VLGTAGIVLGFNKKAEEETATCFSEKESQPKLSCGKKQTSKNWTSLKNQCVASKRTE
jgi:hypothetical protein